MTSHDGTKVGSLDALWRATLPLLLCWFMAPLAPVGAEAFAQPADAVPVAAPASAPASAEQIKAAEAARAAVAAGQAPGQPPGQPGQPGQPGGKPGKDNKPSEGENKDAPAGVVKRPDAPPKAPDPRDLRVSLDEHGLVPPFNFIGQPWPDVMQWLANLSKSSLDWQELPNGYLNLTTQRSYKLSEVHDLINQALNARGFTSIQSGEVLSVFKIEKLDPSVVRQATEEDLYNLNRYDYVKVSFELPPEMEVEKAKDDVKQVLSPNAKVFPLVTTRRLLIMDSAANLRTVSELFNQERMIKSGRIVPKEFILKHARPDHVIEILKTMVGTDSGAGAKPPQMSPEQMAQQQQMMQQAAQRGQPPPKMPGATEAPKVYLAMNRRRNSILVNAPPEQLKIIEQTITYCDVPFGDEDVAAADPTGERSLVKYNLVTMDPEQLKSTLEEIGELDPRTELRADTKSKILFARATIDDHKKIAVLKDELDGTGRKLFVKWLARNLPADAVAGTVMALMGGQEQEEEKDTGYPYWYGYGRRSSNDDNKPKKGFRVDADIENNRLLLWANDAENREVDRFLDELSKAAPNNASDRTVRSFDASDPAETARLLDQLRAAWPSLGGNELIINDEREVPKTAPPQKPAEKPDEATDREARSAYHAPRVVLTSGPAHNRYRVIQVATPVALDSAVSSRVGPPNTETAPPAAQETTPNSDPTKETTADTKPAAPRPPVKITITKDGRLLVSSEDTAALDRLEQFVDEVSPPTQRYKIFHIKYAKVYDVYLNLKEYYEDELKGEKEQILDWWGDVRESNKSSPRAMSKRQPLRLIWDPASDTILVANASAKQLHEIENLIDEYDQPASDDAATERVTQPVKIRYSRASTIAAAVKEVFRDLLSSKDKEFDSKDGKSGGTGSSGSGVTILSYSRNNNQNDTKKSAPLKVGFQGALSLGADDVSNIVLVSAQKEVFEGVVEMIHQLDEEAAPKTTVQVHRLNGNIRAESLQKALDEAVGRAWLGNRPEPTGSSAQGDQQNNDKNRESDRDSSNRRRSRD